MRIWRQQRAEEWQRLRAAAKAKEAA